MSILMFIPNPADDSDRQFSVPVLAEATFNAIVLPVAGRIGAEMVCRLGVGFDVDASNAPQLQAELRRVLENLSETDVVREYVRPRLQNLIAELQRIVETRPDLLLYIG